MDILNIIYNYSTNNKILDIDAIKEICTLIINNKHLNNNLSFITDINKSRLDKYVLGEYDMENTVYIYYNQIYSFLNSKIFKKKYLDKDNLTNTEITMLKNLHIIETILHELEHFYQTNKVKDNLDNSFEKILYQYEYNFMFPNINFNNIFKFYFDIIKNFYLTHATYDISFMERMANINSKEQIIIILKKYNNEFNNVCHLKKKHLEQYKLNNYLKNIDGPTNIFLYKIGALPDFIKNNYDELVNSMSLKERYRYGFDLTDREFKKKIRII